MNNYTKTLLMSIVLFSSAFAEPHMPRPIATASNGEKYLAGQLIVKLKPSLRSSLKVSTETGLARFNIPPLDELNRRFQVERIYRPYRRPEPDSLALRYGCDLQFCLEFSPDVDVFIAARAYMETDLIQYAEPNWLLQSCEIPNDTLYPLQWYLARIGAPFAWNIARGDSNVLIAVLDDACEWHHPDITANLWVNTAEDLNGNGRFDSLPAPEGDLDSIDQDNNGYADDVIGYNLFWSRPNPAPVRPEDDHGTHCWGIANAVTNNVAGVAGVPWNCRGFAFSCGSYGLMSQLAVASGIYYAIDKGAWVISMSFGSYGTSQLLAEACSLAWDAGLVLVGGAGNDGRNQPFYPANYPNVLSVAASDHSDRRAYWSNYGEWIELSSPGTSIYSTVTNHGYGSKDGTSMATPVVAGALAWTKSAFPELTNAQACSLLLSACEPMPDSLYRLGLLGAGRLSIGRIVLPRYYCDLTLTGVRFNDSQGNGNSRPDPGETLAVIVTYRNSAGWQNATNVAAYLGCMQREVQLLKPQASFPDIPAGSAANCSQDSFVVAIPATLPPQRLSFRISVTANPEPAYPDTGFMAVCGSARVLIVDDDEGADYEKWYTSAFDSCKVLYDLYSVRTSGSPSADTLRHYPVVVWFCGNDSVTTLTAADRAALASYLDQGGNLIISGQNIAQNLKDEPFLSTYLRVTLADSSTGKPYLPGIPADPITRGDTMVAGGGGGANNGRSLDGVRPVNGSIGCARFRDYPDTTVMALVRYAGTYRLVFFSIPFEAIDHAPSRYVQRWTLCRRILEWLGERLPGVAEENPSSPSQRPYVLRITPNPFTQKAQVSFFAPLSGPCEIRLYSLDGRLLQSHSRHAILAEPVNFNLDGTRLTSGIYLVQLVTPEGVYAQKAAVLR